MSRLPSQNGAFSGPGRQIFEPPRPRRRDIVQGQGDAFPGPEAAEIASARRALSQPAATGPADLWAEMGWDHELMCWTDPESLDRMAAAIEGYGARTPAELALVRERELAAEDRRREALASEEAS